MSSSPLILRLEKITNKTTLSILKGLVRFVEETPKKFVNYLQYVFHSLKFT